MEANIQKSPEDFLLQNQTRSDFDIFCSVYGIGKRKLAINLHKTITRTYDQFNHEKIIVVISGNSKHPIVVPGCGTVSKKREIAGNLHRLGRAD